MPARALAIALAVTTGCASAPRGKPAVRPTTADAPAAPAPRLDPEVEAALIQLNRFANGADAAHYGLHAPALAVPAPSLPGRLPRSLRTMWTVMTGAIARWGDVLVTSPEQDELEKLGRALDGELAMAGLDYVVTVRVEWDSLMVTPYRIARVTTLVAGDRELHVLDLRAIEPHYIGVFGEFDGKTRVFLDSIEGEVAAVLPVLADAVPFPVAWDTWAEKDAGTSLAAAAGVAVRRELAALVGRDPDPAARIAAAWADDVRFHEARHALDVRREVAIRTPDEVRHAIDALGISVAEVYAVAQLSAFLGELAADQPVTQFTLWSLAKHAFEADATNADAAAVVVLIEALARALGDDVEPSIVVGHIDRDRLAATALPLARRSASELRAAAAAAWSALFGEPFVAITTR